MVANITEEQKRLIESQGYMVVEFKAWYKKLADFAWELGVHIIDTWKAIISFLQEKVFKAFDCLKDMAERFALEFKPYIEKIEDNFCEGYKAERKYSFVRNLGKKYEPRYMQTVIYHRCRDRC